MLDMHAVPKTQQPLDQRTQADADTTTRSTSGLRLDDTLAAGSLVGGPGSLQRSSVAPIDLGSRVSVEGSIAMEGLGTDDEAFESRSSVRSRLATAGRAKPISR